jgi:Kef-type K+ transport system membrane component KefB
VLLAAFLALVAVAAASIWLGSRTSRISQTLLRLQDTTAQIRVRGAVLVVVALAVVAERTGLEAILGAFVAGALLGTIDRDTMRTHPFFHPKLEALGYGFLVPVFFVTSGIRFDLDALFADIGNLALVPLFLAALVLVRGVPAVLYRHQLAGPRETVAAALLQATSLPVIVTATMIGVEVGALSGGVAAAFVAAGLLSALCFPLLALVVLAPPKVMPHPPPAAPVLSSGRS